MAITITQSPTNSLNLSGNPLLWVFSSDATAQPNFSYYIEVYVNTVLNSTHQVFPESGAVAKFDASTIAENNTSVAAIPTTVAGQSAANSCNISIKIFERYGNPPALIGLGTSSSSVLVIKAKKEFDKWLTFKENDIDYIFGFTKNKWLTDKTFHKIRSGEALEFYMVFANTGEMYNLVVTYFTPENGELGSATEPNLTFPVTGIQITYDFLVANYPGMDFDDVGFVRLQINDGVGEVSENITISIDRTCAVETYQLKFLSQIGSVESFTFDRLGTKTMTTTPKTFQTQRGGFVGSTYVFDTVNGQKGTYQVTSNKRLFIESGWLTDSKKEYLIDNLIQSPFILVNGRRVANIEASVRYDKQRFDMLFNITIDVDLGDFNSAII